MIKHKCTYGFGWVLKTPFFLGGVLVVYSIYTDIEDPDALFETLKAGGICTLFLLVLFLLKVNLTKEGWYVSITLGKKELKTFHFHSWNTAELFLYNNIPAYGINFKDTTLPQMGRGMTDNYLEAAMFLLENVDKNIMDDKLIRYLEKLKEKHSK